MSEINELVSGLMQCMGWLILLLYFAMGVVALVRLKATPAGLLIGGSLTLHAVVSGIIRVLRQVSLSNDVLSSTDVEIAQVFATYGVASSCASIFFTLLLGVGFALLPSSLTKLGDVPGRAMGVRGD